VFMRQCEADVLRQDVAGQRADNGCGHCLNPVLS
jgi:hypothetical protein